MFEYQPAKMAREVAAQLEAAVWRNKIANDTLTAKWAHLFENITPPDEVVHITAALIMATQGGVSHSYLYAMALTAWTYGVVWGFDAINDERLRLWDGQPLEFPWDDATEYPPKEGL